ncbi:MAG: GatB/YqeY domain-containing protein [Bauldia sp.]|jgi:uncharacterized protein YqeY
MREKLEVALKGATESQDRRRLNTLRLIKATLKDRDVASRDAGGDCMSDTEMAGLLLKMIRQRQDSAKLYEQDGRPELAAEEVAEIGIIKELLPAELDEAEMAKVCAAAIESTGAQSLRDMGKCMAEIKARYAGKLDFGKAIQLVKSRLQ